MRSVPVLEDGVPGGYGPPQVAFAPLAGAHRLEREIPGAELITVEGAGHFIYDEAPGPCADEVLAFLAETE